MIAPALATALVLWTSADPPVLVSAKPASIAGRGDLARAQPVRAGATIADPACEKSAYDCAVQYIERGELETAITMLGQLLARTPRDLRTLNLLGIALTGAGRVDDGNRRFREALAIDPTFTPARKNLAVNTFNEGQLASAERLFLEVLSQVPDDEIAHLHLGEILADRGMPSAAVRHYEQAGARVAANPSWVLHYASALLDEGETARAVAVFERLPPDDASARFEAGVALGRAGAHAEAAPFFAGARKGYRDPYAAAYNQTLMLVEAGDYGNAVRVAEELFRQDLETGELYSLASRAYLGLDRIQDAYDALRTAARLEPTHQQHYLDLALICLDHENFDLGLEIVDVGIRHSPDAADLHLYRGVLLVMKGLVEQAEEEFERARVLAPDHPVPYVALAMAWMQSGHTPRAVELLRQRVQTGAPGALVPYLFGIALMRSGVDPADDAATEAERAFEHAIRLDPRLAGPHAEIGKILLARGEEARAIDHLERAVALDPDSAGPAYSLAQAYRRTGDTKRAQELLARVSRLNAQGRGHDPDRELTRLVVRLVRQETSAPAATRQ